MRSRFIKLSAAAGGSLVLVLVGMSIFGPNGVGRHERLRDRLADVHTLNVELREENQRLAVEANALRHNEPYIEAVIRDELGWVRSDELLFIFPPDPSEAERRGSGARKRR